MALVSKPPSPPPSSSARSSCWATGSTATSPGSTPCSSSRSSRRHRRAEQPKHQRYKKPALCPFAARPTWFNAEVRNYAVETLRIRRVNYHVVTNYRVVCRREEGHRPQHRMSASCTCLHRYPAARLVASHSPSGSPPVRFSYDV